VAELYRAEVVGVTDGAIIVRGIEKVQINGQEAAVMQEWAIRPDPLLWGERVTDLAKKGRH
jgi:hypothetical protein